MDNQEKMPMPGFPFESKFVSVDGYKMHYLEAGENDPPILLLHGLPVNCYLWRNVIPQLAPYARTIAIDLIGFGKSDKPLDVEYTIQTYTAFLENAVETLRLKNVVLVGMDLGLITGLNYAMRHKDNVKGLVMFEGFCQPINLAFRNMPWMNRLTMRMMKNPKVAERMIIRDGLANVERMVSMMTVRKLAKGELELYKTPFQDEAVRRKVWLEGVGPTVIQAESERPDDVADVINRYAAELSRSPIPKLLLYASPGAVITKKARQSIGATLPNLDVKYVGKGKHFLPEDQPDNISCAIAGFYQRINPIIHRI